MRIRPDAPPTPLRRLLREIVWMARQEKSSTVAALVGPYAAAFYDAPVGVVLSDLAGIVTHANLAFASMLGCGVHEVIGKRVGELSHPEDRALEVQLGNELISGQRATFQVEKRFLAGDGQPIETLT
ncbi:MAG: PAS domain-containing protein, partial [Myxococcota bacterium]